MINFKTFHKRMISEGGAFGHLSHPFDVHTFTFKDLEQIIKNILTGNLDYAEEKCLDGATEVIVDGEIKQIGDVVENNIGEKILSYNTETNIFSEQPILGRHIHGLQTEWIKLELEDGSIIEMTPSHRVFVKNKGYIPACNLTEDDELVVWNELKS